MAKKQIKQSETIEIMRSQINLNPFNPKQHTDNKIKEQKKNLQQVGFLGGVTWNRTTGNLIDGHRRIKAMDLHYGYDGTPGTDYKIKVEAVEFDEKQEKEQMTYMALGNTKADYQLIAEYLPDIDYTVAGIDEYDLKQIQSFIPSVDEVCQVESYDDLLKGGPSAPEQTPEDKKAKVKEAKQKQIEAAGERYSELTSYLTISFSSADEKRMFCELAGITEEDKFVSGSKILELIE